MQGTSHPLSLETDSILYYQYSTLYSKYCIYCSGLPAGRLQAKTKATVVVCAGTRMLSLCEEPQFFDVNKCLLQAHICALSRGEGWARRAAAGTLGF